MSPDLYDGSYNMWDPQSLNRYSYVLNNPFGLRDPTGLYEEICSTYYYDVDGEGGGEQTECFILDDGGGGGWGGGAVRGGGGARAPTNNQPQPKQPTLLQQANKPNGYCSRMEILGAGATVVGGGMFLTGTALDGTFVGAVVGVPLQVSGGIGMALGGVVSGVGFLGKAVGVCQ